MDLNELEVKSNELEVKKRLPQIREVLQSMKEHSSLVTMVCVVLVTARLLSGIPTYQMGGDYLTIISQQRAAAKMLNENPSLMAKTKPGCSQCGKEKQNRSRPVPEPTPQSAPVKPLARADRPRVFDHSGEITDDFRKEAGAVVQAIYESKTPDQILEAPETSILPKTSLSVLESTVRKN